MVSMEQRVYWQLLSSSPRYEGSFYDRWESRNSNGDGTRNQRCVFLPMLRAGLLIHYQGKIGECGKCSNVPLLVSRYKTDVSKISLYMDTVLAPFTTKELVKR